MDLKGSITALITPLQRQGRRAGLPRLVEWQIAEGTDGLVPVGTTGESPTLSHEEHKRVIDICIEAARGRRAGDRRRRLELHREAIELDAPRQAGRRRCRAGRRPTTTSRPRKACTSTSRRWPTPSTSRSCSTTCRRAPAATCRSTTDGAAVAAQEHRRHQGRERRHGARRRRSAKRMRPGLHPALGRGCQRPGLHGPGRRRLHLGDRQRRAAALRRLARRLEGAATSTRCSRSRTG